MLWIHNGNIPFESPKCSVLQKNLFSYHVVVFSLLSILCFPGFYWSISQNRADLSTLHVYNSKLCYHVILKVLKNRIVFSIVLNWALIQKSSQIRHSGPIYTE